MSRRPRPHADPHPSRVYTCVGCGATAPGRFVMRLPHGSPLFNAPLWWFDLTPNEVESKTRLCPVCRGLPHPLPLPAYKVELDGVVLTAHEVDKVLNGRDGITVDVESVYDPVTLELTLTLDQAHDLILKLAHLLSNARHRVQGRAAL